MIQGVVCVHPVRRPRLAAIRMTRPVKKESCNITLLTPQHAPSDVLSIVPRIAMIVLSSVSPPVLSVSAVRHLSSRARGLQSCGWVS